jgi:hypothetical protein
MSDVTDQGLGAPYEYWGQSDPTHEVNRKVSKEGMVARVSQIYAGKARIKKCPKVYSLNR